MKMARLTEEVKELSSKVQSTANTLKNHTADYYVMPRCSGKSWQMVSISCGSFDPTDP